MKIALDQSMAFHKVLLEQWQTLICLHPWAKTIGVYLSKSASLILQSLLVTSWHLFIEQYCNMTFKLLLFWTWPKLSWTYPFFQDWPRLKTPLGICPQFTAIHHDYWNYVPPTKGVGHIVFWMDPVGVSISGGIKLLVHSVPWIPFGIFWWYLVEM